MSLPNNTYANPGNSFYAAATESGTLWYNFPSETGQVLLNDASGTQVLKSIGGDLFFNEELLAKASDLQDIADWSLYPALASVNMDGFSITDISDVVVNNTITTNVLDAVSITNQSNIVTATLQIAGEPVPSLGQITAKSIATSGALSAGALTAASISTAGSIGGGSISTTGGLDMSNTAITRASTVNISNSGLAPYGALTSPDGSLLTWNGQTITTGGGGNAANWSSFPALTNVNMNNNNITGAFSVISQTAEIANVGVGTVNSGKFMNLTDNSITGSTTDGVSLSSRSGQPLTLASGTDMTMTAGSSAIINTSNDLNVTCDGGLNPLITPAVNLTAKNGNGGQVNLVADPGSIVALGGVVNITGNGGTITIPQPPPDLPISVTVGGEVNITANTGSGAGLYTATSAINLNAAAINSYAGAIPPIGSLLGYNTTFGNLGVSICAGLPPSGIQFPGTVYVYGLGIPGVAGGVRIQSPTGIQMLSDTYIENLYPLDGNGLNIQGRSLPTGYVNITDVGTLTMNVATPIQTDRITSVANLGILFQDAIQATTIEPPTATATGTPNLIIKGNTGLIPGSYNNYVEIANATTIAFDVSGTGALSGVKSINGASWPPATGDASLWSQYPATSIIDVSGYGLSNVNNLSGVVLINGSVYPPVVGDVADWSTFPAIQNVDISGYELNNVNNISMPANGTIISAGQLSILADGNVTLAADNGGNVTIGTGNAGSIFIQTVGAGHDLSLAGDTTTITAPVKLTVDTPSIDVVGADIANVSNITNDATNLLTVQSTANLTVSAETALTLVSDSADVTVQGQTGVSVYAATGDVNLTADSGEVVVQDSVLNMNTHKITNLSPGTAAADAVNYGQLTFRDNTEFYVSGQGSDSNNGSMLAPFLTIQAAITAAELISSASSICNINVASGNYPQSLTFNKGYIVLNGTLQSQTGNEVCEITGSITINCTGANDVFNRQVAFQGFNITCGAGQSITNTSTSSHTVSFQDCKIFVNSVCYNSTASSTDARTYFTNVEISSTNAANVSPVITTNVGLVELERVDLTVAGNAIGILIGGTSVLNRCSLSTLDATNTAATLLPLLSFTSTTTATHSLGNVAFAFTSAVAKTATNAVYINSGVATAIIALNCVFTLTGTASSTNYVIGYNGVGSPTIAGINNTSLNVPVLLPQTTTVQPGITQIQYTNIDPPVLGTYSSSIDQTIVAGGVAQAMTLNTSQNYHGTLLLAGSRVYVGSSGNYQINYAVQLNNTSATNAVFTQTFLRKNGANVANSAAGATLPVGTSFLQTSPQMIVQMNAQDYIEVWFSAGAITVAANANGGVAGGPSSPSVIINITQIR